MHGIYVLEVAMLCCIMHRSALVVVPFIAVAVLLLHQPFSNLHMSYIIIQVQKIEDCDCKQRFM